MAVATELPRWNLKLYYPALDSAEFRADFESVKKGLDGLEALFEAEGVGPGAPQEDSDALAKRLQRVIEACDSVHERLRVVRAYPAALVSADSNDEAAQAALSELQPLLTRASLLGSRFAAWVGTLPIEALAKRSEFLATNLYPLTLSKIKASHLMSPEEEALAAQLSETGGIAWGKLHGNYTSQLSVDVAGKQMPMSAVRNLAYDADQGTRQTAYEAEISAWKSAETVLAAAMNGVKGESLLLAKRRGWGSLLDEALFASHIDRPTLDAMLGAARDAFPVFRRYLRAKAKLLGHQGGLPWYDLFAPVGEGRAWGYDEAMSFVADQFGSYSPKMRQFAERSFRENWIDVGPRTGKRDGAFCMGTRPGKSLILMNYKPAFGSVSTLAHELGHGYHNLCLESRSAFQSGTPMTLAETASIFCETIIKRAALAESDDREKLAILEASLQGACQVVVDITSRYQFESEVMAQRPDRELSAREFCAIMESAQRDTYGDGLDLVHLHPYMWAVKPHYYSGRAFYNFPYMFGLLFALGLYGVYRQEGNSFLPRYDELLSMTGLDDAASLCSRFGIDIRSGTFWAGSLAVIADDVAEFERLAQAG